MFDAKKAREKSKHGKIAVKNRKKEEERSEIEKCYENERGENQKRIANAEVRVEIATGEGKNEVVLGHYLKFIKKPFELENLIPPHDELLKFFEGLGYIVSIDIYFEPDYGCSYGFKLKW